MSYCVIIPDRGDRGHLTKFCLYQISRFTVRPEQVYLINYKPKGDQFDLTARVREGVDRAIKDGFEKAYILENDDAYPIDYPERMPIATDIVGCERTTYYNLKNNTWQEMYHSGRSSLFTTGFNLKIFHDFNWPKNNYVNLDIALWNHAKKYNRSFVINSGAIGIKHGIGKCGGAGHNWTMKNHDPERAWLKSRIDETSFNFYKTIEI